MNDWETASLLSLFFLGIWAFLPKLIINHIDPVSASFFEIAGEIFVLAICLYYVDFKLNMQPMGVTLAVIAGVMGTLGGLFLLIAAKQGNISVIVNVIALYPLVTTVLAVYFLQESLDLKKVTGIIFSILSLYLLTTGE